MGPLLFYTLQGKVTLYRISVLSSAEHMRKRKWRQHKEKFKINVLVQ